MIREFEEKVEALAKFLLELYYGPGTWHTPGFEELQDNYRLDATDVLLSQPHLLSVETRVRMWEEERFFVTTELGEAAVLAQGAVANWQHFYDEMKEETES